jgi:subtilisin family serine protease
MSSSNIVTWYRSFLPPLLSTSRPHKTFIHTYREAILGFAVNLTKHEVEYVKKRDGVLKVYEDYVVPLLTTHTPDFLGLRPNGGVWSSIGMGEGSIIIGVLDTGIDVSHSSFDDEGMKPPPKKWRGSCNFGDVKCNNKLIGGRSLLGGQLNPQDTAGHGTHTASTAAGRSVEGASVLGSGKGTAAGMAPHAHLAVYQVCNELGCSASNVMAGMDAAIADGVDILSISLGGKSQPFDEDVIAMGAFSAMRKGIFVSCSAGNSGPRPRTIQNVAPWVLTVGASTTDRRMEAIVKLGDGRWFVGESAYQPSNVDSLPLVHELYSGDATGKVVACDVGGSSSQLHFGKTVQNAGGAGMIALGDEETGQNTFAEAHILPASYVNSIDAAVIRQYINNSDNPTASIVFNGTLLGTTPAPVVAYFSSRGPSTHSPGILKPDIIGPGVNIIAAWPFRIGPVMTDGKNMAFNTLSGTSMSAPHLSGIAAIIRTAHPDWSPAAIKSAIMTTSYVVDNNKKPILDETFNPAGHFSIGAGHVNPSQAVNPGLIYDIDEDQYISYLCGLDGYTDSRVEIITHRKGACREGRKIMHAELNYPSIAVKGNMGTLMVSRTVTNVGDAKSSYTVNIEMPNEVRTVVSPSMLEFTEAKEKKTFTVSLTWDANAIKHAEGSFKWVSDKHVVRSPIVIF